MTRLQKYRLTDAIITGVTSGVVVLATRSGVVSWLLAWLIALVVIGFAHVMTYGWKWDA